MTRRRSGIVGVVGALCALVPGGAGAATTAPRSLADRVETFAPLITAAATRFGLPAPWVAAVLRAESAGDAHAVSRAGALGLMQLMPATWAMVRARLRLGTDPFDPRDNILAGAAYLRELYDRYGAGGFLAAYNAGPARYEAHLRGERPLPLETRAYLAVLAPGLGGRAVQIAAADPFAWRRAPVFAEPNAGLSPVTPSALRAAAGAPSSGGPRADARESGDLFVRLSATSPARVR